MNGLNKDEMPFYTYYRKLNPEKYAEINRKAGRTFYAKNKAKILARYHEKKRLAKLESLRRCRMRVKTMPEN